MGEGDADTRSLTRAYRLIRFASQGRKKNASFSISVAGRCICIWKTTQLIGYNSFFLFFVFFPFRVTCHCHRLAG